MSDFSMQFELWKQCNNFCDFCYLADQNKYVPDEIKLANIERVSNIIKDKFKTDIEQIKAVGFLGGEFFQGQMANIRVKTEFFNLCKMCFNLINENKIQDFWCYCTLTIGDEQDLYDLINLFDNIVENKEDHHFWIQVSYDVKGRFHTKEKLENWNYHMINLQKYPFIRFNVTCIMTEPFLQSILSNEINLNDFQKKYNNVFFFKQPNAVNDQTKEQVLKRMPWFFPKRKTYIDFLKKLKREYPILFNEVLNISLRSDYMYNQLDDEEGINPQIRNKNTWEETRCEIIENCRHPINYQCYSDSDACCLCDYFKIKNID